MLTTGMGSSCWRSASGHCGSRGLPAPGQVGPGRWTGPELAPSPRSGDVTPDLLETTLPVPNDRPETTAFWWGRLPHWEVVDGRYFVTIRLAGSIPAEGAKRIREVSEQLRRAVQNGADGLTLRRRVFATMESWLHRGEGSSHLAVPAVAELVTEALHHRADNGIWQLYEYVIMPNHLHVFLRMLDGRLRKALVDFKTWTGTESAKILNLSGGGLWQKEWFDHWSRSPDEDEGIARYIRDNPVKAGLVASPAQWPHGSCSHQVGPGRWTGPEPAPSPRSGNVTPDLLRPTPDGVAAPSRSGTMDRTQTGTRTKVR